MGRVKVYEAEDLAQSMVEDFNARPWEYQDNHDVAEFWPAYMHNVGDSLAVAYASDKWKAKNSGKRKSELYKHLAESRNSALVRRGLLVDFYEPNSHWDVIGPTVSLEPCPMPAHFAILGLCEEVDLQLYTDGTDSDPGFGEGDTGVVKVTVRHGIVGGGIMQFSKGGDAGACDLKAGNRDDQPFIFVYTKTEGVQIIIVGDDLDVKKDGIVG